ncbi:MAG: GNAT family N-acetyltransferase [Actinomycetota bacterium]|nr:GNAT family N-acetyltransferase [Actinomycetota bacterium]
MTKRFAPGATEVISHRRRPISAEDVLRLYRVEGWWPERSADDVRAVLDRAPSVGAWEGQALVGFARAVTDGRFRAYIEDVVVEKSHRRRGIASHMLLALAEELSSVDLITLFCANDLVPVYESIGFERTSQVVLHAKTLRRR